MMLLKESLHGACVDILRNIIISGGASGIGAATVQTFLELDDIRHIYILDIAKPKIMDERVSFHQCNVRNEDELNSVIENIRKDAISIDILISSAGIHFSGTIEETSFEDYQRVVGINLTGTFLLLKAVLPIMRQQRFGSVVLVASEQVFVGKPHSAVYGLTKAAIGQLTKSTALDYADYNIRVNCVCPGTIDTPLYQAAISSHHKKSGVDLSKIEAEEGRCQPIGRVGESKEVADLIVYLSNTKAGFITGSLFPIDGGYTAR